MVIVTSIEDPGVQVAASRHCKRFEEMGEQCRRDIPQIWRLPFRVDDCIGTPRQIYCDVGQCFVHRREAIAHTDDSFTITEGLVERLTEPQGYILDRVMNINMKITFCMNYKIK